jgi:nucleoside-diphosphate-sugar epimerase
MYEALIQHAGSTSRIIALPMGFTVGTMKALSVLGLSPLGDYHLVMYGRDKIFDVTKARSKLAWTPQYSNTEMICEAYDWFSDNYAKAQAESRGSPNRRIIRQGILHIFKWLLR